MLEPHPGPPTGELGRYYFSYGAGHEVEDIPSDDWDWDWDEPDDLPPDDHEVPYVVQLAGWCLDGVEQLPVGWMARHAVRMIQGSLGLIFLWFGALKLIPGMSPAEDLVGATMTELFARADVGLSPRLGIFLLAGWEILIGLGLLLDRRALVVVWMLLLHMGSTAMPMILVPDVVWTAFPHVLTLEGQYIVKNLVLVGGALAVGANAAASDRAKSRSGLLLST